MVMKFSIVFFPAFSLAFNFFGDGESYRYSWIYECVSDCSWIKFDSRLYFHWFLWYIDHFSIVLASSFLIFRLTADSYKEKCVCRNHNSIEWDGWRSFCRYNGWSERENKETWDVLKWKRGRGNSNFLWSSSLALFIVIIEHTRSF